MYLHCTLFDTGVLLIKPPLKVQKPEIGEGVFIILKIWFPKKLRGVFIILNFFSDSTFLAYFLEHKKTPNFSISPLRNPFLVPKIPQHFRRRSAPIRGVFIILKIWAPKKLRGGFIILKILQKMSRGFLIEGGLLLTRYCFNQSEWSFSNSGTPEIDQS